MIISVDNEWRIPLFLHNNGTSTIVLEGIMSRGLHSSALCYRLLVTLNLSSTLWSGWWSWRFTTPPMQSTNRYASKDLKTECQIWGQVLIITAGRENFTVTEVTCLHLCFNNNCLQYLLFTIYYSYLLKIL